MAGSFQDRQYFLISICDGIIVFVLVRVQTETAVFVAIWQVHKRTTAAVSQNVQRAIAEQAIEIVRIGLWVTGKVFTIPVTEIREMFAVKIFFHRYATPC